MTDPERATRPGGPPPYTEASRAQLVFSANVAELADRLTGLVPIGAHELAADGTARSAAGRVEEAAAIVASAQQLLRDAVVTARLGNVTWDQVGAALDVTGSSAQERFVKVVEQFRLELYSPRDPHYAGEFGQIEFRLDPAAREPEQAAADLDEWVRRRHDPTTDLELAEAPVSGGLARMDPMAVLRWVSDVSHHVPPPPVQLELAQLTLAAWEEIAADRGRRTKAVREGLKYAHNALDKLRKQAESITPPEQRESESSR
jgi:hypothetical protein